jgi:multicomponent K+:H+ antiporter subunit F
MTAATILAWGLGTATLLLVAALALAAWRIVRGPRAQDRVLGLDTLYLNAMLLILVLNMATGSQAYFEAALIIGLLGFGATVALAKFLMRGEVIE